MGLILMDLIPQQLRRPNHSQLVVQLPKPVARRSRVFVAWPASTGSGGRDEELASSLHESFFFFGQSWYFRLYGTMERLGQAAVPLEQVDDAHSRAEVPDEVLDVELYGMDDFRRNPSALCRKFPHRSYVRPS